MTFREYERPDKDTGYTYSLGDGWEQTIYPNKIYKHKKGDLYIVEGFARSSSNPEEVLVLYRALYGDCTLWARPVTEFCDGRFQEHYIDSVRK